jgi:hypothetical protein
MLMMTVRLFLANGGEEDGDPMTDLVWDCRSDAIVKLSTELMRNRIQQNRSEDTLVVVVDRCNCAVAIELKIDTEWPEGCFEENTMLQSSSSSSEEKSYSPLGHTHP